MLNKEVYKAAYPLHDGEYSYEKFQENDSRRTANVRQVNIVFIILYIYVYNVYIHKMIKTNYSNHEKHLK